MASWPAYRVSTSQFVTLQWRVNDCFRQMRTPEPTFASETTAALIHFLTVTARGETYSGIAGIAMQDASLQESMGPIIDRTKENLVSTDNGIIMARHRMLKAIKAMEQGVTPPGVDIAHQRVRSAAVVLPPDKHFKDAAKEALVVQTGKEHVTV